MRALEVFSGFMFLGVSILFLICGMDIKIASAIHQIYQMMYIICAVLCAGFGCLMIKGNK